MSKFSGVELVKFAALGGTIAPEQRGELEIARAKYLKPKSTRRADPLLRIATAPHEDLPWQASRIRLKRLRLKQVPSA